MRCGDCHWFQSVTLRCDNAYSPRYSNLSFRTDVGPYAFTEACGMYMEVCVEHHTDTTVEGSSTTYVVTPYGTQEVT